MIKRRDDLKKYFAKGQVPTDDHFEALIDSMVNSIDDRFSRQESFGLKLGANDVKHEKSIHRLITFYRTIYNTTTYPAWFVDLLSDQAIPETKNDFGLSFSEPTGQDYQDDEPPKAKSRLYIQPGGQVGIGTQHPQALLDVNGFVASKGRIGTYRDENASNIVKADGNWHPIISGLTGINAFEIVAAAYGEEGNGQYSIAHAIAMSAFGSSRSKIRRTNAWFDWWSWFQKIKFRWTGSTSSYNLEIKTNGDFGENAKIICHITQLFSHQRPVIDGKAS